MNISTTATPKTIPLIIHQNFTSLSLSEGGVNSEVDGHRVMESVDCKEEELVVELVVEFVDGKVSSDSGGIELGRVES